MKDRVDKSRGIVTLIPEVLPKNETHRSHQVRKHTTRKKRKRSDSSSVLRPYCHKILFIIK